MYKYILSHFCTCIQHYVIEITLYFELCFYVIQFCIRIISPCWSIFIEYIFFSWLYNMTSHRCIHADESSLLFFGMEVEYPCTYVCFCFLFCGLIRIDSSMWRKWLKVETISKHLRHINTFVRKCSPFSPALAVY